MMTNTLKLSQLKKRQSAKVVAFEQLGHDATDSALSLAQGFVLKRMMEMGIVKGAAVKIVHEAPFGKDPIAIEVRGAVLGLRRDEADLVYVEIV